jgi:hypothetical protein
MGFNLSARPGRPYGGEALGLLALARMLEERYGTSPAEEVPADEDASEPTRPPARKKRSKKAEKKGSKKKKAKR